MANRYTATEKWEKSWFCSLTPTYKLFFIYLCENCNNAGIWDVNWAIVKFQIWEEGPLNPAIFGCREDGEPRVIALSPYKWFIRTFVLFQQKINALSDLNPDNNAHKQIIRILEKEGVCFISGSKQRVEGPIEPHPRGTGNGRGIGRGIGKEEGVIGETKFPYLVDGKFKTAYSDYLEMRKKIRKPVTLRAEEIALEKLHKHPIEVAIKMLDQSVFNSWQGIFELKAEYANVEPKKRPAFFVVQELRAAKLETQRIKQRLLDEKYSEKEIDEALGRSY